MIDTVFDNGFHTKYFVAAFIASSVCFMGIIHHCIVLCYLLIPSMLLYIL